MSPPATTRAARRAVSGVFFASGALFATWAARIPALKRSLAMSDGQLGLALLGIAVGALLAFSVTGYLTARFGSRRITLCGGLATCAVLPLIALMPSFPALCLMLLAFGACNGVMDVAMNAQGVEVERRYARPILSSFHGLFSLGGLAGAAAGGLLAAAGMSPAAHFALAAASMVALIALAAPRLLPSGPAAHGDAPVFALPPRALLGLGAIAYCAHLSEGAMADWSGVYLQETLGTGAALAAAGYAAFSSTMTATRFVGDRLVAAFGPARILRGGGLIGGLGLCAALIAAHPAAALLGFAAVGIGMAVISPLVFSAAGRTPGIAPGTAIAAVATMGYSGFLTGPPLIGLIAEHAGLSAGLGLIAALALLIAALSGRVAGMGPG